MITDLTKCLEDTNGSTAYKLLSDGSFEVWIGDAKGTYFIRFNCFDDLRAFYRGVQRIVNE
jgi:hypothetical protein